MRIRRSLLPAAGRRRRDRLERIPHDLPHERPARFQLVEQVEPRCHHRIGAQAFSCLGARLVAAAEMAQEIGAQARRERLQGVGEVSSRIH